MNVTMLSKRRQRAEDVLCDFIDTEVKTLKIGALAGSAGGARDSCSQGLFEPHVWCSENLSKEVS